MTTTVTERLAVYADLARWAPSKHNTQPWRFTVYPERLDLWTDTARALTQTDPDGRERLIALGAAVEIACVAARGHGRCPRVELFPTGPSGPVARLTEVGRTAVTPADLSLLAAVPVRRTDRGPLDASSLPAGLPFALQQAAQAQGVVLRLLSTTGDRATLARLVERADRLQAVAGIVQPELDTWLRTSPSARDGVPATSSRGARASYGAEFVQRDFSVPGSVAVHDRPGRDEPLVGVLCTTRDTPQDWVMAGRGLAAVLLRATVDGAQACYLNQPVELPALRVQLGEQLTLPGPAQLVLRLGVGAPVAVPPRRLDVTTWATT